MPHRGDLIRVVQRLSFCRDLDDVMEVLKEAARRLTGADGVTVVLRDGDLCHYADEDAISPLWKGRRFPMETCISGWCMMHRRQVVIGDIYKDARIPHDAYRPTFVKSLAMTPIRSDDPVGAIGAYWAAEHRATPEQLQTLQALGDAASTALANVQLFEAIEESNRRKDQFLAMLAHELRNPLVPIRNAAHVLRARGDGSEAAERAYRMLERQMGYMDRMIDDLLDVSRLTRGQVELKMERVDLAQLVGHAAEDQRAAFDAAGLTLEVDLSEVPIWVNGDPTRLAQVVGNLLDNARRFTPSGGRAVVRVEADLEEGQAVVAVRDTGRGIEPEVLPRIFHVFSQSDRSLDRREGGLGLGLPVARELVALHGGTLQAGSEGTGRGAEFTIRLPKLPEPPALVERNVAPGPDRRVHVLVVEDNRDAAETLKMVLEISGYRVTLAQSGPEGVEAAKSERPQVVLCDIGLPGMDGYAVASTLRQDASTREARLIAVSGYGNEDDRKRALAAGFDLHLVKPVHPERLLRHLSEPQTTS